MDGNPARVQQIQTVCLVVIATLGALVLTRENALVLIPAVLAWIALHGAKGASVRGFKTAALLLATRSFVSMAVHSSLSGSYW